MPSQILDITNVAFLEKQQSDSTLDGCRKMAQGGIFWKCKGNGQVKFQIINKTFFREFTAGNSDISSQLVVLKDPRKTVLKVAHYLFMAGHLGVRKTGDRVLVECLSKVFL